MSTNDKALAYKQMFELTAWKEFKEFLDSSRKTAIEKILSSDDLKEIHTNRGWVQCLNSIDSHLDYETK